MSAGTPGLNLITSPGIEVSPPRRPRCPGVTGGSRPWFIGLVVVIAVPMVRAVPGIRRKLQVPEVISPGQIPGPAKCYGVEVAQGDLNGGLRAGCRPRAPTVRAVR